MMIKFIEPNWPTIQNVAAFTTTRGSGVSESKFASFNLAKHVGDNPEHVDANRQQLQKLLPSNPLWLSQTHSSTVIRADNYKQGIEADSIIAQSPNQVCAVLTGDCLPILLSHQNGKEVAAIHAGWRGLAQDIIAATLAQMTSKPNELMAWLGPAIGPTTFQVKRDVYDVFTNKSADYCTAFKVQDDLHWLADIYQLARLHLRQLGVHAIYGGDYCTLSEPSLFYSARRDGQTGRMASLIWIKSE